MKRLLAALLLLGVMVSSASATTYHVLANGGNDGNSGTSRANAWQTIGKANRDARPGDIVYLWENSPFVYLDFPNPDSAGHSPIGGGYITFIGASLYGDPMTDSTLRSKVIINAGSLNTPYTVIKGLHILGKLDVGSEASRDTIRNCIFDQGFNTTNADYINVIQNSFLGGSFTMSTSSAVCDGNFFSDNKFWDLHENGNVFQLGGGSLGSRGHVDSLFFRYNRVTINNPNNGGSNQTTSVKFFNASNIFLRSNYWQLNQQNTYRLTNPDGSDGGCPSGLSLWTLRDSTRSVDFSCDTLVATSDYCNDMVFTSSGNYQGTVKYITIDSCFWQGKELNLHLSEPFKPLNVTYTTFASLHSNVDITAPVDTNSVWDHNTFVGNASLGVVHFWAQSGNWTAGPNNRFTFTNNIIAQNTFETCFDVCKPAGWVGNFHWGMFWGDETKWAGRVTSNYNLYYVRSSTGCPLTYPFTGNRNIGFHDGDYQCSASGAGSLFDGKSYVTGGDSLSKSGDPQFYLGSIAYWQPQWPVNGAGKEFFNPQIGSLSVARGAGSGGTDIGARAYISRGRISYASSQQLAFDCTEAGCSGMTGEVTVVNVGTDNLTFSSIVSSDGLFTSSLTHFILGPGMDTTLTITSTTADDTPRQVVMIVTTDDPVTPVTYIYVNVNAIWKDSE